MRRPGAPPVERGKIRAAVHDWLAASRHSRHIAAVRDAHRRHGGGGSLYIVLRRAQVDAPLFLNPSRLIASVGGQVRRSGAQIHR